MKAGLDENNIFPSLMSIGKTCVSYKAKDRPEMQQVLRQLDCVTLHEKHQCKVVYSIIFRNNCLFLVYEVLIVI